MAAADISRAQFGKWDNLINCSSTNYFVFAFYFRIEGKLGVRMLARMDYSFNLVFWWRFAIMVSSNSFTSSFLFLKNVRKKHSNNRRGGVYRLASCRTPHSRERLEDHGRRRPHRLLLA